MRVRNLFYLNKIHHNKELNQPKFSELHNQNQQTIKIQTDLTIYNENKFTKSTLQHLFQVDFNGDYEKFS